MKHEEYKRKYAREHRWDWRYRFWKVVLWPRLTIGAMMIRRQICRRRNRPHAEGSGARL